MFWATACASNASAVLCHSGTDVDDASGVMLPSCIPDGLGVLSIEGSIGCRLSRECVSVVQVLIPHKSDVKIESMTVSQDHLVVFQRIQGLQV